MSQANGLSHECRSTLTLGLLCACACGTCRGGAEAAGRISLGSGRTSTLMTHASIGIPYSLVYMLAVDLWGLLLA